LDNIVDSALAYSESAAVSASSTGDQGVSLLDQSFYDRLAERLRTRILDCGARVPIITGYFGPVPGSLLAQIGRGYTDLCAALCAVGLGAAELQVWKEVDGIFTADPRKVPTARLVPVITPDEAAELTYYGSEVIHPFTMEQVIRAKIPIRIKNVENPKGSGTIIYPQPDRNETGAAGTPVVAGAKFESRLPTAITVKDQIVVINIHSNRKTISHGFLARIFGTLDRAGVVVDLISTSEVHLSMAMQDFDSKKKLDRLVKELEKIGHVSCWLAPGPVRLSALTGSKHPPDHRVAKYGHLVAGRPEHEAYGRYRRQDVQHSCGGQHQHRDDQSGKAGVIASIVPSGVDHRVHLVRYCRVLPRSMSRRVSSGLLQRQDERANLPYLHLPQSSRRRMRSRLSTSFTAHASRLRR
jgi:hypothetical protein